MKKLIVIALISAVLAVKASAQVFGGGVTIGVGTTNSSYFATNVSYVTVKPLTIAITAASTNAIFIGSSYYVIPGGGTNFIAAVTNNMAGYTNATLSVPSYYVAVTNFTILSAHNSTNTMNVYVP